MSSTLIDVVLHNKDDIKVCKVLDFPFSDHDLVLFECKFRSNDNPSMVKKIRRLTKRVLEDIRAELDLIDFNILNEIKDVNNRWSIFKQIVINLVHKHAPLKLLKKREIVNLPWYDSDLVKAERKASKLYSKSKKYSSTYLNEEYLAARQYYQSLLRFKKTQYFEKSTRTDFKESKDFWKFHSKSVKIKSDHSNNKIPSSIKMDGQMISDIKQMANTFNQHFTSFDTPKTVSNLDCQKFIYDSFSKNMRVNLKHTFKFKNIKSDQIEKMLLA